MSDNRCPCPNFNYHNNCGECRCDKHQGGSYDNQFWCSLCNRNYCTKDHLRSHNPCNKRSGADWRFMFGFSKKF